MKAIETEYKGYRFRSRLEARWAVFFDACNVKWEYEPEGFDLGDGLYYLPDFLLHDVWIRNFIKTDLWIEVKGLMTEIDAKKIIKFVYSQIYIRNRSLHHFDNPILIVTNIPEGNDLFDLFAYIWDVPTPPSSEPCPFNFELIDADSYAALPCISPEGRFAIVGSDYTEDIDEEATLNAYRLARQARFEHRNYFKPLEKSIPTKKEKIGAEFLPTTTGQSLKEQILQLLNEQEDQSVW